MRIVVRVITLFCAILVIAPARSAQIYQISADSSGTHYAPADAYAGSKIPLIVVHGLNETIHADAIQSLSDRLALDAAFTPYFQIFTLEYDTSRSIDENGAAFVQELLRVVGSRRFVLVGYSMGGLVARSALELHEKDAAGFDPLDRCLLLVTLGTPHHGTPFANPLWMKDAERRYVALSLLDYVVTQYAGLDLSSTGVTDMAWDGYDGGTPASATGDESLFLKKLDAAFDGLATETARKYAFIGGYSETWPDSLSGLLSGGFNQETEYRTLGYVMGKLMPGDSSDDRYLASDGLVPLSSALYLKAAPTGETTSIASEAPTAPKGEIGIALSASAIDALKPSILASDAVHELHYAYPADTAVYEILTERLAMPDSCDGDANEDGLVTIADAQIALKFLVGLSAPTGTELLASDCDRNGAISLSEVIRILRKAIGL